MSRVGLLFGGPSVEHEVSVVSARGVAAAMAETSLECIPIAITRGGSWLNPEISRECLDGDAASVVTPDDLASSGLLLDLTVRGLARRSHDGSLRPLALDAVFPLVHGWGGEDGRFQGALELAGIPYVGSGVAGSAVGMDKAFSKRLFESNGLVVGPWIELDAHDWKTARSEQIERVESLGFPVFVKPCNGGSSVGITRLTDVNGVAEAIEEALALDPYVVVERGIDAREIECAVLGNARPEASGLGEIIASRAFYDYDAKYVDGTSELVIPAPLGEEQAAEIRELAVRAFRALKLRGLARVDFLVERESGTLFINEVNTLPGFTPISMFSKLWEAEGLSYPRLVERLVELALEA